MPSTTSPLSRVAPLVWLILVVAALAGAWWWWQIGRPVALESSPTSRIACVSYAPFREPGETPLDPKAYVSPERIDADLRALSQRFDCVRTYSQGAGLDAVPAIAARYGMKVLMGIWLQNDDTPVEKAANQHEIQLGIATALAHPDVLRGVIVGNEVLLRGQESSRTLAGYVRQVHDAIHASGVPVTYADVWEFWLRYPEMADAVDYITIHILPYWEDEPVAPADAIKHVADVYAKVKARFPGREVMIGETGWPSHGKQRRGASASLVNEARYLRDFLRYAGSVDMPYNVIEAFDQPWKRAQEGTVGGYWGIFDVNAQPKFGMQGPVVEEPRWRWGFEAGAGTALLFLLVGAIKRSWRGWRGWLALLLAGFATGLALAWQWRQAWYGCNNGYEWSVAMGVGAWAMLTALWLARFIAARLSDGRAELPPSWLRFSWLFDWAYFGVLLAFDGRYRDFPLGMLWVPALGYLLVTLLADRSTLEPPSIEQRFLAGAVALLAVVVVAQEWGLNPVSWWWLLANLALAGSVLVRGRRAAVRT